MIFETNNFGKCEVICTFKDIAIIELERNVEKYVVAIGFDYKKKRWKSGYYCQNLEDASATFNNILSDFYMVIFKA